MNIVLLFLSILIYFRLNEMNELLEKIKSQNDSKP